MVKEMETEVKKVTAVMRKAAQEQARARRHPA